MSLFGVLIEVAALEAIIKSTKKLKKSRIDRLV